MNDKHDFKGALERLSYAHTWRDGMTVQEAQAVLQALCIADMVVSGESSDKMQIVGHNAGDFDMNESDQITFKGAGSVYKAMIEQLIKDMNDE